MHMHRLGIICGVTVAGISFSCFRDKWYNYIGGKKGISEPKAQIRCFEIWSSAWRQLANQSKKTTCKGPWAKDSFGHVCSAGNVRPGVSGRLDGRRGWLMVCRSDPLHSYHGGLPIVTSGRAAVTHLCSNPAEKPCAAPGWDTDKSQHTVLHAGAAIPNVRSSSSSRSAWTPSQVPMPFKARWNCQVRRVTAAPLAARGPAEPPRTTLPIYPTTAPARAIPTPASFLLRSLMLYNFFSRDFTTEKHSWNSPKKDLVTLTHPLLWPKETTKHPAGIFPFSCFRKLLITKLIN